MPPLLGNSYEKIHAACIICQNKSKTWSFAKVSALDLIPSKQSPIQVIGAMQRGSKMRMLTQGKAKF